MQRILFFALFSFALVQGHEAQSTIYLVRHAEKAQDASQNAKDPALSEAGRARAEALAAVLKDAKIQSVYATEFQRTQQTAGPVARLAGREVSIVPAAETPTLLAKMKIADGNILVVGHSNTLPEIIKLLGVRDPITLEETEYDNLFVLSCGSPPELLRLRYAGGVRETNALR